MKSSQETRSTVYSIHWPTPRNWQWGL